LTPGPAPRTGVLSGGALRAVSHLGAVACLRERGLSFNAWAGCSGGALFGAVLAAGLDPRDILKVFLIRSADFFLGPGSPHPLGLIAHWLGGLGRGLADTDIVGRALREYLPADDFDALPDPLAVNAVHLATGTPVAFTGRESPLAEGCGYAVCRRQPVSAAVAASLSLPGLFRPTVLAACRECRERDCGLPPSPREKDGLHFIDGGLLDSLPLALARRGEDSFTLGLNVRLDKHDPSEGPDRWSLPAILSRTADIVIQSQVARSLKEAAAWPGRTVVLVPDLWPFGVWDRRRETVELSFQAGFDCARAFLEGLGLPLSGSIAWDDLLARLPERVRVFSPAGGGRSGRPAGN
jgi:predicted acylesterase/phospholipase RssA